MSGNELHELRERLRSREAELDRLAQELAETNRGVVALYAELDERARALSRCPRRRRASSPT